ncbi:DUF2804 domain-containing protein, partial [Streptomyces erythrochromogenes]|uniref:DUF2804 domain-containing protein n=1 Tax=Streptomyces erythrochromogenes TaxID=285574 RepID=UPI00368AADAE
PALPDRRGRCPGGRRHRPGGGGGRGGAGGRGGGSAGAAAAPPRAPALGGAPPRAPGLADLPPRVPDGHETLSVVVPWSDRRFQYTSKHTARPASGTVTVGDDVLPFGDGAWAVLDHGRGRWPRRVRWNWGAASGRTGGHTVGIQLGGQWTRGTGSTENALCVDGRLTKIGRELVWDFAPDDPLAPWTVHDGRDGQDGQDALVDLRFTPFHVRRVRTDVGLIGSRTDQCFGHYAGTVRDEGGRRIAVDGLLGWAENVRMRW